MSAVLAPESWLISWQQSGAKSTYQGAVLRLLVGFREREEVRVLSNITVIVLSIIYKIHLIGKQQVFTNEYSRSLTKNYGKKLLPYMLLKLYDLQNNLVLKV